VFERHRYGVRLTPAGSRLLPRAVRALDDLDAAFRDAPEPMQTAPVRLGAFPLAAAGIVPDVLAGLARRRPEVVVTMREGTTAGLAITTVATGARTHGDVHLVGVRGEPQELRRLSVARLPGTMSWGVSIVHETLIAGRCPA
jgi:DNA-binding transcriptional LysR family regulator